MDDTSGFYKQENGELLYGPNFVLNKNYELRKETHEQHNYPVDGWHWYDSELEARLNLKHPHEIEDSEEP